MKIDEQRRIALKYQQGHWTAMYKFYCNPNSVELRSSSRLLREIDEILEDKSNERQDATDLEMLKATILGVPYESISRSYE